jgi:hypothetical protein
MIYFGFGSRTAGIPSLPWHDLYFSISTPLQGTGIQLVWEYYSDSARTWVTIPGLVDETNKFTQSGWVRFPVPSYWFSGNYFDFPVNGIYSMWIRVRLVSGTVTNGGAVNQQVVCHDNTITVKDYPSVSFSDIYTASTSNNWGVVTKQTGSRAYLISANLLFVNSTLYSSGEFIQIGYYDRPASLRSDSKSKLIFGRLTSNGVGVDGSEIYIFARMTYTYITVNNIYLYGSRYVRYGGDFTHNFGGNIDIVDSQLVGDMSVYILPDTNTRILRVLYSSPVVFRLYSKNATVSYLFLPAYTSGVMAGTNAKPVIANVVFLPNQTFTRYGNANATLLDCVISPSQIYSITPFGTDVWVKFLYSFDLKLVDKDGRPVSGATVKLYDTYNNLVFSLTTNSTGQIPTQYVMTYITWWNKSENWTIRHEKYYNPFTLVVSHPNYPPVIMKWNIQQKVDLLLPIDPLDPAELYVNTTRNIYLPKDVVIINAYVLYENAKQTGLTINVTVFKPDGSKSPLIQLRDDGQFPDAVADDGLYAGLFTDTSMTGIYLVNASTIYQSGLLRANWTFLVDNTAELILKVNSSLSAQISSVNNTLSNRINQLSSQVSSVNDTLSNRISQLSSQLSSVNNSLYTKIVDVNNTLYLKINDLTLKLTSVNGTLYNTIINMNRTLHVKLTDVHNSLYALITAVNNSLYLKISEISGISFDTTPLENKIASVNNTLYTKLNSVNATLYGKIIQVNNSLYLKVNDVLLRLNSVNGSLYSAISSVNSTIQLKLAQEESTHEDILNKLRNINLTLYGKLEAVNNTLVLRIEKVSGQIQSVNNTVTSSTNTITSKLSEIKDMLSKINVDFTPVLNKIDQATSTILDAIGKLSSQIKQLQDTLQKNQLTLPSWVFWLIVAQVFIIGAIFLVVKRQPPAQFTPYLQPPEKHRVFNIVFAIVFLVFAYLLLNSFSALLPIPIPLAFGIVTLFTLIALYLGVKRTLALAILLGLIVYLAWTQHIEISLPSPPNPPSPPSEPSMPSIPLPIISLATVFIIFTIIYIILWRRKKQQEVMLW